MTKKELFNQTAKILKKSAKYVEGWCVGGEEDAIAQVTPKELAEQIREYEGRKKKEERNENL
jgi:hypothetical protein